MKKILFTALLALVCSFGYGQDKPETQDEIFWVVEQMPEFPGGDEAMFKYLSDNLSYPKQAREAGIQGKVMVGFVVEADGRITNVEAIHYVPITDNKIDSKKSNTKSATLAIYLQKELENEGIRVIKAMPKWIPGKQRGKNVRVAYRCPITFTLN
ncbi:MAG: energy transducer TonB [Bacteroidales bacterium]|nr:energy transducer TonB [Bacteroidales bacterium]